MQQPTTKESNINDHKESNIIPQIKSLNTQYNPNPLIKEDIWETDTEENENDPSQYFRLKLENIQKIKSKLGKYMRNKPIKYKKIDEEIFDRLRMREKYFKTKVYPFIKFKEKLYEKEENLNKIILDNETYNVDKKVELGSALIFEINNENDLNLIGVSKEFFDVSTKIHYLPAGTFDVKTNTIVSRNRKKKPKVVSKKEMESKIKSDEGKKKNKNKKKKKRLIKHKTNSTIREIKIIK